MALKLLLIVSIISFLPVITQAWSTEELALYDLVEEIEGDFYQFLSIGREASLSEIKKAYRRLSIQWHPDKNQAEGAGEMFRKIAAVYEVLKSAEMREKYNDILERGLPDWRQPVYYFRRARKMSWMEALIALLLICTAGHYLMLWGAYIDKYLTLWSSRSKLRKKEIRQLKKLSNLDADEIHEAQISEQLASERPKACNLLPFLLISFFFRLASSSPAFFLQCYREYQSRSKPAEEEEPEPVKRFMQLTPQPVYEYAMASDLKPVSMVEQDSDKKCDQNDGQDDRNAYLNRDQKWTCDELVLLVKLSTEKYPAGTPNRWDHLANALKRHPDDVTAMVGKLKLMKRDEYVKLLRGAQSSDVVIKAASITAMKRDVADITESTNKKRDCGQAHLGENENTVDEWTQNDQKLFETALQRFPKGTVDRWDRVVEYVPNKTKQQCLERFKYLSEMVRQRKIQQCNKKS